MHEWDYQVPPRYGSKVGRDRWARRALEKLHPIRLKPAFAEASADKPVGPAVRPCPAVAVLTNNPLRNGNGVTRPPRPSTPQGYRVCCSRRDRYSVGVSPLLFLKWSDKLLASTKPHRPAICAAVKLVSSRSFIASKTRVLMRNS